MPTRYLQPRSAAIGSALLVAFVTQVASAQPQPPRHANDDDGWFASQLRRYRSYPHLQQAFNLIRENRLEEAARQLAQTIAIDPDNRGACIAYLDVSLRQQRYGEAIAQANRYLSRWPGDAQAIMVRAQARGRMGKPAEAMGDYESVYRDGKAAPSDRALAAHALANWAMSRNQPEQALGPLDLALRYSDTPALRLLQAQALAALTRIPEAERAYQRALSNTRKPDERLAALRGLANLALQGGSTAKALPYLKRVNALAPRDQQARRQLVHAYFALGRYDDAAREAQALLERSGSAEDAYLLGTVQTARHAPSEAIAAYENAAHTADSALRAKALLSLGYSARATGQEKVARAAFAQAQALPGGEAATLELRAMRGAASVKKTPAQAPAPLLDVQSRARLLAADAYTALQQDQTVRARNLFERALTLGDQRQWRAQLAEVYRHEGDLARARQTLAMIAQPDVAQLRQLAAISLEMDDAPAGLDFLGRAARQSNDARDYLGLGRAALEARQDGVALQAYRVAQAKMGELEPAEQDALLAELGYAYLRNGQDARALETLAAVYRRVPTFALALELANLERQQGALAAARERLAALDGARLSLEQKQIWYATRADLARQAAEPAARIDLLREAVQVAPNASLHYQLGLAALDVDDRRLAREQLLAVRRLDPDNWSAALQLGYVCQAVHDLPCAVDAFEAVARLHPQVDGLAEAIAYAYTELGDNDRAVAWFKRAIDRIDAQATPPRNHANRPESAPRPQPVFQKVGYRLPAPVTLTDQDPLPQDPTAGASGQQIEKREALRQQIGAMTRSWQLNGYQSVRNGENQQGAGRAVGSGALFSQGGLEFQMRVPGLGYQDGRILQLESRLLWGNHPGTLAIDRETLQGTLGIAYKPFKEQDGYLRLERLVKIGSQAQNNWLLHASWGTSDGWGWNPVRSHWNYSTLYVDAGVMLQHEQTRSLYAEARQGRAFAIADRTMLTPHLVLAGRAQRPDPTRVSYVEAGAGLSLKTGFNGSRYVAERSSVEVLLQYRKPISSQGGGWALSLAAQF